MTVNDLIKYRLGNQQLSAAKFATAGELVSHFGAMQAQDYAMAKWAIGIRTDLTDNGIEQAINKAEIIRTHILRPTWHFVAAGDVRWMLPLTAARIKAACAAAYRMLELDAKTLVRCNTIIERSLASHKYLTREEIMLALNKKKINSDGLRSIHIMMNAEQDGIVCNGPIRGKQFTYALLDERVPAVATVTKDEAYARLARKYFASHGPATLHDFSWWSGLPLGVVKTAAESIKEYLDQAEIEGKTYWFIKDAPCFGSLKGVYFLPAFDEFMVSYKDRSHSLEVAMMKEAITGNGIFRPIIVIDGKVAGLWKRTVSKDGVVIETQYFDTQKKPKVRAIEEAARRFGSFLGKETALL